MDFISSSELKELSRTQPLKTLGQIAFDYFFIFLFICICVHFGNIFISLVGILLIAARQQGLGIVAHDGVHYRISTNKKINDAIVNWLIAYPFWASLDDVRLRHLLHHQETNTDNDPDYINKKDNPEFQFPQSKIVFLKNIIKYIFCLHWLQVLVDKNKTTKEKLRYFYRGVSASRQTDHVPYKKNKRKKIPLFVFNMILLLFLFSKGWIGYYLLYWILPFILVLPFLNRIRAIGEHFCISKKEIEMSRTMYPKWWDEMLFGLSWNITYHLDHHLYPSVPSYNIRKLHRLLLQNKEYKDKAHITTQGSWGVFKECTSDK